MGTLQLEKLWKYLQTLSLTDDNKEWLANKLIESKGMSRVCEDETEYIYCVSSSSKAFDS